MRASAWVPRVLLLAIAGFLASGCADVNPPSTARRIESRSELPGGIKQYGDVGDWVLQNSHIRAVILDAGHAASPALWGGALVDADLVRPWEQYRAGHGLDQFYLLLPFANLQVPHPEQGQVEAFTAPDGSTAVVRVTGRGDRVLSLLNLMDQANMLGVVTHVVLRTDYELPKDASYIRMTTTFKAVSETNCTDQADDDGDGAVDCDDDDCALDPACTGWCDRHPCPDGSACDAFYGGCLPRCDAAGQCAGAAICDPPSGLCLARAVQMNALAPGTDLLDVLSGGLLNALAGEDVPLDRKPGYVAGDMALFGSSLMSFAPGIGFEIDAQYRLGFLRGRNALKSPLSFDFLCGTGDGVSYGYFSKEGAVLFPFATESLTGSVTHGLNCLQDSSDDATCDDVPFVQFTRYLSVGEGDIASASRAIHELRGTKTGELSGLVMDGKTAHPVTRADVYAIADPCDPANCIQVPAVCGSFPTYEDLVAAARECTREPGNPDGRSLMATQFRTDAAAESRPEGRFNGSLIPGAYWLVARIGKGPLSAPARVVVSEGRTTRVALSLPEAGRLTYRALDEAGRPVGVRVTVGHCFPECHTSADCPEGQPCDAEFQCRPPTCASDGECDADETCTDGHCACASRLMAGEPREELGDGYMSDRKAAMAMSADGTGEIILPPGRYDVVFSHGFESEIDSREVVLSPGRTEYIGAYVPRVVDTRGWASVDQHVHTAGSSDAATKLGDRLTTAVADGLDVMAITDHDFITNPVPLARQMHLENRVLTLPGEEVTTLDISHLIGWPLKWAADQSAGGALNWTGKTPREIFAWMRSRGLFGADDTLVTIPHPRGGMSSYYDVYSQSPFDLTLNPGSIQKSTPLLVPANFAQEYDLVEVLNSKRLDITRMPTYDEVERYNVLERKVLASVQELPREKLLARMAPPSREILREMLTRTPAEQEALHSFVPTASCSMPSSCAADADCKDGKKCSPGLNLCKKPCATVGDCDAGYDCLDAYCSLPPGMPCDSVKGMTEDWLRMLDYGIFKPGVGGSDVHGIANYEIGCLRNYVRVPTDDPAAIDAHDLIHAYRRGNSFATWGPFVDVSVDGKGPGETAVLDGRTSVPLRVRVQKPSWFDVSRVEVLRNGVLEYVWDVDAADPKFRIAVPSHGVVALDATVDVSPGQDSWFVVFAMGVKGKAMNPVYGSSELPPVYLGDLFSSMLGSLPLALPAYIVSPRVPVYYPQFPFAVTNPVFLDVDGVDAKGCRITPIAGPAPAWACNYPPGYPAERMPCICR